MVATELISVALQNIANSFNSYEFLRLLEQNFEFI